MANAPKKGKKSSKKVKIIKKPILFQENYNY